jgi:hypothetical protein
MNAPEIIAYAIVIKKTGKILNRDNLAAADISYKGLAWKLPKKVYQKLGHAKGAFTYLPDHIKNECVIHPIGLVGEPIDVEALRVQQEATKALKEQKKAERKRKLLVSELEMMRKVPDFKGAATIRCKLEKVVFTEAFKQEVALYQEKLLNGHVDRMKESVASWVPTGNSLRVAVNKLKKDRKSRA